MQKRHRLKFFFLATFLFFAAGANADIWDEVSMAMPTVTASRYTMRPWVRVRW